MYYITIRFKHAFVFQWKQLRIITTVFTRRRSEQSPTFQTSVDSLKIIYYCYLFVHMYYISYDMIWYVLFCTFFESAHRMFCRVEPPLSQSHFYNRCSKTNNLEPKIPAATSEQDGDQTSPSISPILSYPKESHKNSFTHSLRISLRDKSTFFFQRLSFSNIDIQGGW